MYVMVPTTNVTRSTHGSFVEYRNTTSKSTTKAGHGIGRSSIVGSALMASASKCLDSASDTTHALSNTAHEHMTTAHATMKITSFMGPKTNGNPMPTNVTHQCKTRSQKMVELNGSVCVHATTTKAMATINKPPLGRSRPRVGTPMIVHTIHTKIENFTHCICNEMDTDIVVARYKEDINWLSTWPAPCVRRVVVYDKSDGERKLDGMCSGVQVINGIENVGREAETYIRHIVENYDDLAERVIFTQARFSDHCTSLPQLLAGHKRPRVGLDMGLNDTITSRFGSRDGKYCYKGLDVAMSGYTLGKFCERFMPRPLLASELRHVHWPINGIFMTTRDQIHKNPKELYVRLWNESNLRREQTPDSAFLMERLWFFLFA